MEMEGAELCAFACVCVVCVCNGEAQRSRTAEVRKRFMSPIPCLPPSPSSCSLSPLSWWLQPCNSLALKAKINCQQLVSWVLAAVHPSAPDPVPLGSWLPSLVRTSI